MRIAVVFDTPYAGWSPEQHAERAAAEIANWRNAEPEMEYQVAHALANNGHDVLLLGVHEDLREMSAQLGAWKPELVFNATEAFLDNAELDYLIPALLEAEGYRYTGAPPLALLVTRNKAMSKKILSYHGLKIPGFKSYRVGERIAGGEFDLRFPVIVKPLQTDASEGISQASIVHDAAALNDRLAFVHERFGQPAIAEEYIEGRELYATVMGNGDNVEILPLVEMVFDKGTRPEERIATARAKWDPTYRERRGIRNVFARRMSKVAAERLATTCQVAYRALWLRDYGRLDVRLAPDGEVWFIEANANPFLSHGHDSAESAHKAGLAYDAFIQRIVDEAMGRKP